MKKVTGIGGVFFKAKNTDALNKWYHDELGFKTTEWGATFIWNDIDPNITSLGRTVWSVFKADTKYFDPSTEPYMFNYRVDDLVKLMEALTQEGVQQVGTIEEYDYGKFGWIVDPEGRKLELWQPIEGAFGEAPETWTGPVVALGGIFFKSKDPQEMKAWYKKHLDIGDSFLWKGGKTTWNPLPTDSKLFEGCDKPYMFQYLVNDDKSGFIFDPEGNKIQLSKY